MWTVFAFAGAYEWTIVPLFAGVALLVVIVRPPVGQSRDALVDGAIALSLAAIVLQLMPIPAAIRHAISPAAFEFDRAVRLDVPDDPGRGGARPLSLDPRSTAWAFALSAAVALVFWTARRVFADGGVRKVARATAWTGLIASALAITQHATAPRLLYWYWRPEATSARPYTPFVNRNDLACWLVMALPLTLGYAIGRIVSRRRNGRIDLESALDPTTVSLASSVLIMMGTLLAIESRSGITAGAAGVLAFVAMSRARMDRDRRGWLLVGLASLMAAATAYANVEALATRAGDVLTNGVAGRRAIWRETWVMARDFWTTGVGAGAYERGMLVYQTSARPDFYFNHAHSEYLQIVTEGGLLLALPLAVALVAGGAEIARRVAADRSPAGWIRVGAASGLVAVAVQSVWETGLQVPANAVLFAILAAIALHEG